MSNSAFQTFTDLSSGKQIGIIGSLAVAIVAIIVVMMWGLSPSYRVLYSNLNGGDASSIMDQLSKSGVDYKLNEATGSILVGRDDVYKVRLKMSSLGLPGESDNLDFFDSGQRMGLSKSMESARLKRMMEMELAKTINIIDGISKSRVHIALPPNSVFSRERGDVTASVILSVSEKLANSQIKSIISLVSNSIPRLSESNVSVVDSQGNLLSTSVAEDVSGSSYVEKLEISLEKRLNEILGKIVGSANVDAKVSVMVGFNEEEKTSEIFSPASGQIRSEVWSENVVSDTSSDSGKVPGALTNQPLKTDVTALDGEASDVNKIIKKKDGSYTKNYEIDKVITHIVNKAPVIKRITVAVILNTASEVDANGKTVPRPRTEDELAQFKEIVKNTVGYQENRKDNVVVISRQFEINPLSIDDDSEAKSQWWESNLALEGGKWGSVLISIMLIIFLIIRPIIRNIFAKEVVEEEVVTTEEEIQEQSMSDQIKDGESQFASEMDEVRSIAKDDPAIVAQVVKNWIKEDEDNE